MDIRPGDLGLLDHPAAQRLLHSAESAQLAYNGLDGNPRAIPIWFHWDGSAVVFGTQPHAPKVAAIRANPAVAVSVDSMTWPYEALYLRGTAAVEVVDDLAPEYAAAAERYLGTEQGKAWAGQLRGQPMARIRVTPRWANVIDFQVRFPVAFGA